MFDTELTTVQITETPGAACVADWQSAARAARTDRAEMEVANAAYDWSEFSL